MKRNIAIYSLCLAATAASFAMLKYCGWTLGERTITIFAVFSGAFLVIEGGYKIARFNNKIIIRLLRMLIGAVLLGFHLFQL